MYRLNISCLTYMVSQHPVFDIKEVHEITEDKHTTDMWFPCGFKRTQHFKSITKMLSTPGYTYSHVM